mmetsp:Transcript_7458/g.9254  ORF Transcript_7458/g.9254 Transcript_7458/m.9254 type:complete len:225 (+) Transcript_7458:435-1109(+)
MGMSIRPRCVVRWAMSPGSKPSGRGRVNASDGLYVSLRALPPCSIITSVLEYVNGSSRWLVAAMGPVALTLSLTTILLSPSRGTNSKAPSSPLDTKNSPRRASSRPLRCTTSSPRFLIISAALVKLFSLVWSSNPPESARRCFFSHPWHVEMTIPLCHARRFTFIMFRVSQSEHVYMSPNVSFTPVGMPNFFFFFPSFFSPNPTGPFSSLFSSPSESTTVREFE